MNENQFWQVIDAAKAEDTCLDKVDVIIGKLTDFSIDDIFQFQKHLDQLMVQSYTSKLWAAAYLLMDGCSDDCFDYFRAWVMSQGRSFFEEVIGNPDVLGDLLTDTMIDNGFECEEFLSVAFAAYQEKTDEDDFYDQYYEKYEPKVMPDIELDWDEDDEESLAALLPNLYKWLEG